MNFRIGHTTAFVSMVLPKYQSGGKTGAFRTTQEGEQWGNNTQLSCFFLVSIIITSAQIHEEPIYGLLYGIAKPT